MAFSKYFSDYNTSSRCIYRNGLIELRSICMLQCSCIIEHEKYFVLLIVVHSFKIQKCNNRIKFKRKNLFHLNIKNKFLMSKLHIQRKLLKRAIEICKKRSTAQVPLRHTFSVCLNICG